MSGRLFAVASVAAMAVFSMLVLPGYRSFVGDQRLYLPPILRELGLTGLGKDFAADGPQTTLTFFDEGLVSFVSVTGLELAPAMAVVTFMVRCLYLSATYLIAARFTRSRAGALLASFVVTGGSIVFGTATDAMEVSLHPRLVVMSLSLFAFWRLLARDRLGAAMLTAAGFFVHLPTSVPMAVAIGADLAISAGRREAIKLRDALAFFILAASVVSFALAIDASSSSFFNRMDAEWLGLAAAKDPYLFLMTWREPLAMVASAAAYSYLYAVLRRTHAWQRDDRTRFNFDLAFWVPLGLTLTSFVFSDLLHLETFVQMQLARSLYLWKVIIPIVFLCHATERLRREPRTAEAFCLIGASLAFAFLERALAAYVIALATLRTARFGRTTSKVLFTAALAAGVIGDLLAARWIFLYYLWSGAESILDDRRMLSAAGQILIAFLAVFVVHLLRRGADSARFPAPAFPIVLLAAALPFLPKLAVSPPLDPAFVGTCTFAAGLAREGALFVVEPSGDLGRRLRLFCGSGVYVTENDGAQAPFDRAYAFEWRERVTAAAAFFAAPREGRAQMAGRGVTHAVSPVPLDLGTPPIFTDGPWNIYALR
jgi:hypothetical protein